jgi:hypothetical protein
LVAAEIASFEFETALIAEPVQELPALIDCVPGKRLLPI